MLNLLPRLSVLFSRVLIPRAVRAELFKRRTTKDRLRKLIRSYAFIVRCDDYDKGAVEVLLIERARQGVEDRGEVEAIAQAAKLGATVIVDDPWGRELAIRTQLEYHGTLWVLRRLHELGLLPGPKLREGLIELWKQGIRLPRAAADEILTQIGEAVLTELDV